MPALAKDTIIGVIGAGAMGSGIAQVAASAGYRVKLHDRNENATSAALKNIKIGLDKLVKKGKRQQSDVLDIIARIDACNNIEALKNCGLIVEAIVEDLSSKQAIFQSLEKICAPETILASNTSSISITAISRVLKRPDNFVGMHFFNPAPVMKLVEVVKGLRTSERTARTVYDTAVQWGKKAVFAKSTPGFIVNRVARPFYAESLKLLEENVASVSTIDTVFRESGGFRMGPFELMDLIGLDVNYAVTQSVFNAYYQDPRYQPSLIQKERVDAGSLGRKSGIGFYQYDVDHASMAAQSAQSSYRPSVIECSGSLTAGGEIQGMAHKAGIKVNQIEQEGGTINVGDAYLRLTDGRTATQVAAETLQPQTIVFDLMADFKANKRIALCKADQATNKALDHAVGFFQCLGKTVSVVEDSPGLILMRTLCMLANEAADAVYQGVCDAESVDNAMMHGVNYPFGPIKWAEAVGIDKVCTVIRNLQTAYGTDRYRLSLLLQRRWHAGKTDDAH